jgi:recombination protein RecR
MNSSAIQKLVDIFNRFPTIGPRTAARFVFYLLKLSESEIREISATLLDLKKKIKQCPACFDYFEPNTEGINQELCEICRNPKRNNALLCIVEKETDLASLEKIRKYQGKYFVLGGILSKFNREDLNNLRMKELLTRIEKDGIEEIIIAINPTTEGEATTLYLERTLKPLGKKITRLGRGLPIGGELEYADEETLSSALDNRK